MSNFAVIFDVDGVLVDNIGLHFEAWNRFCSLHNLQNIDRQTFKGNLFGKTNSDTLYYLFNRFMNPEEIQIFSHEKESIYREIAENQLYPLNGLITLLNELKASSIPFAIASSGPLININFILEQTGLANYFTIITDSSWVKMGKPNPEVFITTANRLGISPSMCLVFEDSISGIQAAKNAGMKVIALATTHTSEELPDDFMVIKDFNGINCTVIEEMING